MLQFFCRHPAAARCDSSCSPIRWMASAWIAPKETFSTAASVFLESGIEVKCRTKQMFLYSIPNRGKDISSINTLKFLLRKQAHMIVCHTIEELWVVCLMVSVKLGIRNEITKTFLLLFFVVWILLFLLARKHYLCIIQLHSLLSLSPRCPLLYDKSHSCSLFNNHCIYSQLGSTNTHNIQE